MQADRNERFTDSSDRRGGGSPVLVTAAALVIVAGIAWLVLRPGEAPPEEPATTVCRKPRTRRRRALPSRSRRTSPRGRRSPNRWRNQ